MRVLILVTFIFISDVFGAVHIVTSGNDSGIGTLREKIEISANGDTILFSNNVSTVWLSGDSYLLDEKALTIDGGSNGITINRFAGLGGFFFLLSQDTTLTDTIQFHNLSLQNGNGDTFPAIFDIGINIILENCSISNYTNGSIVQILGFNIAQIINSTFFNNSSDIYSSAFIIHSKKTILKNIQYQNNIGFWSVITDFASIESLEINNNEGVIGFDADSLDIKNCLFANINSNFAGLRLSSQNGIIKNCSITGNVNDFTNGEFGGGVFIFDSTNINIQNCTITNNSVLSGQLGAGIFNEGGNVTIKNSIIANNTAGNSPSNLSGEFISGGFNIISDTSGSTITGQTFVDFYNVDSTSLGLLPLADNGGFSETIGLSPNSIAINNGSQFNSPLTDQRGFLRDSLPDIGAFEFNAISEILESKNQIPKTILLSQNYPNPFNPTTSINYELRITNYENGRLTIFNILGKKVKEFEFTEPKGNVVWNGKNEIGNEVSSGIYFYKLEAGKFSQTKKMVFLK